MSRSLFSTAASICVGSMLLLGCQPTESGSHGTTVAPTTTTTVASNSGDGDGNEGSGNGGGAATSAGLSCDALRAANARLTDLSMILGNLTQDVLDRARLGDAGGLDPRTMGKTIGVIQPLATPGSDMAASLGTLQPVFELLGASLQSDVELSATAIADLQAGGGVVAAVAETLKDTLKDKCPESGEAPASTSTTTEAPSSTEAPVATTDVPSTTEAPATTEVPVATTEVPVTTTEAGATTTTEA
jgi:hypothetical protein